MEPTPHRIRRQRWLLRAGSGTEAFAVRQRLREAWEGALCRAFEEAFDELASGDEVIRIPKIELRLKVASADRIPGQLPELIHQQLVEQLQELRNKASWRRDGFAEDVERADGAAPGRSSPRRGEGAAWKKSSVRQDRFERLLHYVRTGLVRWEASHLSTGDFASELKETCREYATELRDEMLHDRGTAAGYFRLFQLMAPADAGVLATDLLDAVQQSWKAPLAELLAVLLESGEGRFGRHAQLEIAAGVLSVALAAQESGTAPDFEALLDRVAAESRVPSAELAALASSAAAVLRACRTGRADPGRPPGDARESVQPASAPRETPPGTSPGPAALPLLAAQSLRDPDAPEDFPLLVGGAGLVLLHPFLPRFFETLGVEQPGGPVLSSLPRAAALLHFLATGREEIFECDLAFIKVLLGLKPESPLSVAEGLITGNDREEAGALLQAAITHWPALRNTTPAGLRHSFLNRQGLLREAADGWRLQVERTGYDVLLDQLPWGIGVVKMPWMKRPLHTEW